MHQFFKAKNLLKSFCFPSAYQLFKFAKQPGALSSNNFLSSVFFFVTESTQLEANKIKPENNTLSLRHSSFIKLSSNFARVTGSFLTEVLDISRAVFATYLIQSGQG